MTWKPPIPWQIIARRGFGLAYVAAFYSAPTYAEAVALRDKIWTGFRPYGVPPWDSIEIREKLVAPRARVKRGAPPFHPSDSAPTVKLPPKRLPNAACRARTLPLA